MVTGGTDTSSNTIEFAMAEMMHNPEIMKRVQEELEVVVGKDNMVEESHIHKLSYLQAVFLSILFFLLSSELRLGILLFLSFSFFSFIYYRPIVCLLLL